MATNGFSRAGRSGRTPHFLTVGLLVVICILAFNYWNVSSQNKLQQKEREEMTRNLEELALRRVHLEKRSEALDNQLRENNQNIQALTNDKNSCLTSLKETGEERDDLRNKVTENDEQLKDLQRLLEGNNQQLDDTYDQLRKTQQSLEDLQNSMQMKDHELQEYRDRNEDLARNVQMLQAEKEQCISAYQLLESKQKQLQQPLHVNQAVPQGNNLPVPPNELPPDLSQQQLQQHQQQPQLPNGVPLLQNGGQTNLGQRPPSNFQVPAVPNVPLYMKQTGGEQQYGRIPNFPDIKLNLPIQGDNQIPGDLDDKENEDEQRTNIEEEKGEMGEEDEKNGDEEEESLKQSDGLNDDSKPMVQVDPGMVNQLKDEEEEEDGGDAALDLDEDGDDKGDSDSPGLKNAKEMSENAADGGLSNMDSESDAGEQEDPDKAIEANVPSADDDDGNRELFRDNQIEFEDSDSSSESSYELESDKEKGGLQIERGDLDKEDIEEFDDGKLRFEGNEMENQLNPMPNGR